MRDSIKVQWKSFHKFDRVSSKCWKWITRGNKSTQNKSKKQIRKRGRRCQIEYRAWVFTGWLISSFQLFSIYCSVLWGLSLSFLMLYRRAQDLHSLSAMATGQFICGCNSIIMAIKLLEYMGDTVGLSSLQIIISQKADNWGSIGSVKTVIGEMGRWEAPLWERLCGGERMERAVAHSRTMIVGQSFGGLKMPYQYN